VRLIPNPGVASEPEPGMGRQGHKNKEKTAKKMKLHNLLPAVGSNKKNKRIGRGPGSGYGGTSTRGHKGAKSR